jgi:CRP-like cAMP-binding protein
MDDGKTNCASISAEMDGIIRKIKDGYAKGVLASNSLTDWQTLCNREVKKMNKTLVYTITKLDEQAEISDVHSLANQSLDSDIEHSINTIRTLPLFRGLYDATLRNVLKGSRLLNLDKNTSFLSQGENNQRFYILIDGWAKTSKSTADGQETLIQIIGKKECLVDTIFTNQSPSPLNAKTITKCKILSLSISVLRDHASRNHELAHNLLATTTQRLHKLINQYEQVTLRTAYQRVGWFLINLYLEFGLAGEPLKLPYDKALIAALLNIKPETFSRVLQNFRKQGFIINKDYITLPSSDALCAFCDSEMSLRCCHAESKNCASTQKWQRSKGSK